MATYYLRTLSSLCPQLAPAFPDLDQSLTKPFLLVQGRSHDSCDLFPERMTKILVGSVLTGKLGREQKMIVPAVVVNCIAMLLCTYDINQVSVSQPVFINEDYLYIRINKLTSIHRQGTIYSKLMQVLYMLLATSLFCRYNNK